MLCTTGGCNVQESRYIRPQLSVLSLSHADAMVFMLLTSVYISADALQCICIPCKASVSPNIQTSKPPQPTLAAEENRS